MTVAGIIVVDIVGILALVWILDLTRVGRLYVGYAAVFVVGIVATLITASWAPLRARADGAVRALFPGGGILVVFLIAVGLLLVYVLAQITVIANRLSVLVQELAIRAAEGPPGAGDPGRSPDRDSEISDVAVPPGTGTSGRGDGGRS